ncbi:MAG: glycosyltransferase [Bacteroidota bacterium]
MNVFIIPSWYPSDSNPLNGIFIREQVIWMAEKYREINFGISVWGQNHEPYLLRGSQPFTSVTKMFSTRKSFVRRLENNVWEFHSQVFSFSSRINKGNITNKVKACKTHLLQFERNIGKANLIHSHVTYPGGYIAQSLSKEFKIPYIITEHFSPFPSKYDVNRKGLKHHVREALMYADELIAVSNSTKNQIESCGIKRSIRVLPNFIRSRKSNPLKRASTKKFTFITVCGLHKNKGLLEFLEAIHKATLIDQNLSFILVGDGPDKKLIEKKIYQLGIQSFINLTGQLSREETLDQYQKANAHILTSYSESFGVVYLEAMRAGLPSIAISSGGPLDIIDGRTGILIKRISANEISKSILWLKRNIKEFTKEEIMGVFESKFSVTAVAPQVHKVYQEVILNSKEKN